VYELAFGVVASASVFIIVLFDSVVLLVSYHSAEIIIRIAISAIMPAIVKLIRFFEFIR